MEFMVIFSAYIGYILAIGISPISIVTGLLGTITLPLIPLLYCGVISLIVMYLFQGIRNRKVLNGIMALLALALVGGTYLSFRGLESFSIETYVQSLTSGENAFLNVMNRIFYPGYLLVHSAATKNWLEVLFYIVLNLVALGIFLGLANLIYLPGLYSYKSVANKNTHAGKGHMTQKQQSVFWALLKKEVKTIFRTPAFVSNCIVINFFWPILIVIVCIMQKGNGSIQQFIELNQNGNVLASIITLAIFLGLAALTTAANSLASSAFTREGAHIDFMKFIPVPYERQIQVKGLLSIGISFLSYLVDVAVLSYILQLSGKAIVYYVTGGFTLVLFITCLGLCLDSNHPKLIWEDELNALRGNLNVFFNMAFAILATGIIIGVGFLLYLIPHSTIKFIYAFYLILLILLDIYMYDYTMEKTVENLDELAS
jgi:ABC-2 type transport system permease protein